jgi:hypothetical protein
MYAYLGEKMGDAIQWSLFTHQFKSAAANWDSTIWRQLFGTKYRTRRMKWKAEQAS